MVFRVTSRHTPGIISFGCNCHQCAVLYRIHHTLRPEWLRQVAALLWFASRHGEKHQQATGLGIAEIEFLSGQVRLHSAQQKKFQFFHFSAA